MRLSVGAKSCSYAWLRQNHLWGRTVKNLHSQPVGGVLRTGVTNVIDQWFSVGCEAPAGTVGVDSSVTRAGLPFSRLASSLFSFPSRRAGEEPRRHRKFDCRNDGGE